MRNRMKWILAAVGLVGAPSAFAAVDYTIRECNGCTAVGAAATAAQYGSGQRLVYDLPGNHFYKFDCEPGFGGTTTCTSIGPPAATQTDFNNYRLAWLNNGQSETFHAAINVSIPSQGIPGANGLPIDNGKINAFGTITNSNYQYQVDQYLQQEIGTDFTFFHMPNPGVTKDFEHETMIAVVTFDDGSTRTFLFNKNDLSPAFNPVPGTAKDSAHNALPDNIGSVPSGFHQYNFTTDPHGYDRTNIYLWLTPTVTPPPDAGNCQSETFDGESVNCIHPF